MKYDFSTKIKCYQSKVSFNCKISKEKNWGNCIVNIYM